MINKIIANIKNLDIFYNELLRKLRTQILMLQILCLVFIFIIIMMDIISFDGDFRIKNEINIIGDSIMLLLVRRVHHVQGCPSTTVDMKDHNVEDKINLECPACPECPPVRIMYRIIQQ